MIKHDLTMIHLKYPTHLESYMTEGKERELPLKISKTQPFALLP